MTLSEFKPPNSSTPEVDSNSDLLLMDVTEDDRQLEVLTGASKDWDKEETPSAEAPGKRKRPTRRGGRQKQIEAAIARQASAAAASAAGAPTGQSAPTLQAAPPQVAPPQVVQPPPKIPAGPPPPMPEPQWDMHCAVLSKGRGRGRLQYRHMAHTNRSPSPLGGEWRIVPAPQSKDPQRTSRRAKPERPRQQPSQARQSPRRRSPERPTQGTRPTSPRPRRNPSPRRRHSPSRRRSPRQRGSSDHSRDTPGFLVILMLMAKDQLAHMRLPQASCKREF
ncbi:serine/arginine repetitive matrix protein 1-like [Diachasma alloeum]|uniref:serine/arginine repetitive matrix protein 1-like n=1 Tax=Diachasma alloeum TaxID=454923 RepID=UPI0007382438|nr:serine/arginine repetitive matrix protein 1-like [Diachasma alloeum]